MDAGTWTDLRGRRTAAAVGLGDRSVLVPCAGCRCFSECGTFAPSPGAAGFSWCEAWSPGPLSPLKSGPDPQDTSFPGNHHRGHLLPVAVTNRSACRTSSAFKTRNQWQPKKASGRYAAAITNPNLNPKP